MNARNQKKISFLEKTSTFEFQNKNSRTIYEYLFLIFKPIWENWINSLSFYSAGKSTLETGIRSLSSLRSWDLNSQKFYLGDIYIIYDSVNEENTNSI